MSEFKLPEVNKTLWLAALESGEYKQCTSTLYDSSGYCCLGVFAKGKGAEFHSVIEEGLDGCGEPFERTAGYYPVLLEPTGRERAIGDNYSGEASHLLDDQWGQEEGITPEMQQFFAALNDGTTTAEPIADDDPLFPLYVKYAVSDESSNTPGYRKFGFVRHTFAEIAEIIRTEF